MVAPEQPQSDAGLREARIRVNAYMGEERRPYWKHKLADWLLGGAVRAFITVYASEQQARAGAAEASRESVSLLKLAWRQRDECMRDLYGSTDDWNTEQMQFLQERFDAEMMRARRDKSLPLYEGPEAHWPETPWRS